MSTCYGTARRLVDGYLLPVGLKVTANLLNEILTASSHEALIDRIFMAYTDLLYTTPSDTVKVQVAYGRQNPL
jgi:hypothetical protein